MKVAHQIAMVIGIVAIVCGAWTEAFGDFNNRTCYYTGVFQTCDDMGYSVCNGDGVCGGTCQYCNSGGSLPEAVCVEEEGGTCPFNPGPSSCGDSTILGGNCGEPNGVGSCDCYNVTIQGNCPGATYYSC